MTPTVMASQIGADLPGLGCASCLQVQVGIGISFIRRVVVAAVRTYAPHVSGVRSFWSTVAARMGELLARVGVQGSLAKLSLSLAVAYG